MDFDRWLTTDPDDVLDKYPTYCDRHHEHRPCCYCKEDEIDRQIQEYYDERQTKTATE